ncbi:MAG: hypothetical protein JNN04_13640 [Cyclobacteriaceae bacterium]|nr:hypothetical protein [Cyclobacteriaceae bacterium]
MLDLFNRRKKLEEEARFLGAILEKLPHEDPRLRTQLEAGIIRGIRSNRGHKEFCHDRKVARQFESTESSSYSIEGIRVRDQLTSDVVTVEVHIAFGLVAGYSVRSRNFVPDLSVIDVSAVRRKFRINSTFEFVKRKLECSEWSVLDPDDVYRVTVGGYSVVHLVDVGHGDFLAMDHQGTLLLVTHDPVEMMKLDLKLADAILEHATPLKMMATR